MQRSPRNTLRALRGLAVLLAGASFLYTQLDTFFGGPALSITSPSAADTEPSHELLTVSGTAGNVTALSLNGNPITIDQNGTFSELLLLPRGFSILELIATDRFGRTARETRTVVYTPLEEPATTTPTSTPETP